MNKPSKLGIYFKKISTGELVYLGKNISSIKPSKLESTCDKYLTEDDFQYVVLSFYGLSVDNEEIWGYTDLTDYILGE